MEEKLSPVNYRINNIYGVTPRKPEHVVRISNLRRYHIRDGQLAQVVKESDIDACIKLSTGQPTNVTLYGEKFGIITRQQIEEVKSLRNPLAKLKIT